MRTSISFLTTTSATAPAALLAPAPPHRLELLGHDPEHRSIWFAETCGAAVPLVHVMHLAGEHAGRLLVARSWYDGAPAEVAVRILRRLDALEARLQPLDPLDVDLYTLTTRVVQRRALRTPSGGPPIRKFALALAVEPIVPADDAPAGRATVTAYLRPRAAIERVWRVRGEDVAVARVGYVGVPAGLGADKQTAILTGCPLA